MHHVLGQEGAIAIAQVDLECLALMHGPPLLERPGQGVLLVEQHWLRCRVNHLCNYIILLCLYIVYNPFHRNSNQFRMVQSIIGSMKISINGKDIFSPYEVEVI